MMCALVRETFHIVFAQCLLHMQMNVQGKVSLSIGDTRYISVVRKMMRRH